MGGQHAGMGRVSSIDDQDEAQARLGPGAEGRHDLNVSMAATDQDDIAAGLGHHGSMRRRSLMVATRSARTLQGTAADRRGSPGCAGSLFVEIDGPSGVASGGVFASSALLGISAWLCKDVAHRLPALVAGLRRWRRG